MTAPATLRPLPRSVATRRTNRITLTLLALVLTTAGVLALATGFGAFGPARAASPVLIPEAARFAGDTPWFWPVTAAAGALLALLALRWLAIQLRSNDLGVIAIEDDRRRGETVLSPSALTTALDTEIESYHGVTGATSSLRDHHGRALLLVKVGLDGRVGVAHVRDRIENQAVPHARQALDDPHLPVRVEIAISPRRIRHTR